MKTQMNFRASNHTVSQINALVKKTGMNQTEVISVAIDRMYRQEIKMDAKFAILKALRNSSNWMNGAVVVAEPDGYDAIPGAWLNDISYTGSQDVIFSVENAGDVIGHDINLGDCTDEFLLDYITDVVIPDLGI